MAEHPHSEGGWPQDALRSEMRVLREDFRGELRCGLDHMREALLQPLRELCEMLEERDRRPTTATRVSRSSRGPQDEKEPADVRTVRTDPSGVVPSAWRSGAMGLCDGALRPGARASESSKEVRHGPQTQDEQEPADVRTDPSGVVPSAWKTGAIGLYDGGLRPETRTSESSCREVSRGDALQSTGPSVENADALGSTAPAGEEKETRILRVLGTKKLKTMGTCYEEANDRIQARIYSKEGLGRDEEVTYAGNCFQRMAVLIVKRYHVTFESVIGLLILTNSICIGYEIEASLAPEANAGIISVLSTLETMFMCLYVLELVLRLLADGTSIWRTPWFAFDCTMVFVGGLAMLLVGPLSTDEGSGGAMAAFEKTPLARKLRLARLVRVVRMIGIFADLWKLCVGLLRSAKTVASACVLVALVLWVFGCLGIEVITKSETLRDDPVTGPIVEEHFSSIPQVLLTLIQFANADSIGAIYMPILHKEPSLCLYFVPLVVVVTILLRELVTAAVVESAIKTGSEDFEMQRWRIKKRVAQMTPQILSAFREMDITKDGVLDRDELEQLHFAAESGVHMPKELRPLLNADTLQDLFDMLDRDHDGKVESVEFIEGVCMIALSPVPVETMQTLSLLRHTQAHLSELQQRVSDLHLLVEEGGCWPAEATRRCADDAARQPRDEVWDMPRTTPRGEREGKGHDARGGVRDAHLGSRGRALPPSACTSLRVPL